MYSTARTTIQTSSGVTQQDSWNPNAGQIIQNGVRGHAPETQVGLSGYSVTIVRGRVPETWDWLAVISVLVETFGNYRVVRPLSDLCDNSSVALI